MKASQVLKKVRKEQQQPVGRESLQIQPEYAYRRILGALLGDGCSMSAAKGIAETYSDTINTEHEEIVRESILNNPSVGNHTKTVLFTWPGRSEIGFNRTYADHADNALKHEAKQNGGK